MSGHDGFIGTENSCYISHHTVLVIEVTDVDVDVDY